MIQLLFEEGSTNKTTEGNESSVKNSCDHHKAVENTPPPPKGDTDVDVDDMGHSATHIPLYEGYEDPKKHWFICESTWEANAITSEDKQMEKFTGALWKRELN